VDLLPGSVGAQPRGEGRLPVVLAGVLADVLLRTEGVEKIVEFKLDATEQALMDNSANAVKGLIADLEKMGLL